MYQPISLLSYFPPRFRLESLPLTLNSLLKCHLVNEAFPFHHVKDCNPLQALWVSLVAQMVKKTWGLIPGSGRSPGEGNGYPLQCSCLENPKDRGAWGATVHGVTESDTNTHTPGTPSLAFLALCPACNTCNLLIC